jgi:hypothetical protein
MLKLSKQTRDFLTNTATGVSKLISKVPDGQSGYIEPGGIFFFNYYLQPTAPGPRGKLPSPGSVDQRVVLVVRNRRTSSGVFTSTQNNILLSCFRLEGNSELITNTIVENLYKKRRRASYWGKIKTSLIKILGKGNYRTYNTENMKQTYKVYYKGLKGDRR